MTADTATLNQRNFLLFWNVSLYYANNKITGIMQLRTLILALVLLPIPLAAQPISSRMHIGMNLAGVNDWMTEMPFVDVMHQSREWMTHYVTWMGRGKDFWDTA